jgi:phosphosulfolactate synthase (CoM biosynthesis protein A)
VSYDTIIRKQTNHTSEKRARIGAVISDCDPQIFEATLDKFASSISMIRIENFINRHNHSHRDCNEYTIQLVRHHDIPIIKRVDPLNDFISDDDINSQLKKCFEAGLSGIQLKEFHEAKFDDSIIIKAANEWNLNVYFEINDEDLIKLSEREIDAKINNAMNWLGKGATKIIAKVTTSPQSQTQNQYHTGITLNVKYAEVLVTVLGLHNIMFKAASTEEQSRLFSHFGKNIQLCDIPLQNVPLVERLRLGILPTLTPDQIGENETRLSAAPQQNGPETTSDNTAEGISDEEKWYAWIKEILSK